MVDDQQYSHRISILPLQMAITGRSGRKLEPLAMAKATTYVGDSDRLYPSTPIFMQENRQVALDSALHQIQTGRRLKLTKKETDYSEVATSIPHQPEGINQ
jgi:hypothetical protein